MKKYIFYIASILLFVQCAQRGTPSGGPKDITPPKLVRAVPDTLSTNVSTKLKEINLYFDELVQLRDYSKNIIISPPVEPAPTFLPAGTASREVQVKFNDTLRPNTTYTINFGKSIVDNNEGNPYSFFTYVFSTGKTIDSLTLSGEVKDMMSNEPLKDIVVALYEVGKNYSDSVVFKEKPYYIAKVDSANRYEFKYLKAGKFRLVAFEDKVPNVKIDLKQEKMAFASEIINTQTTRVAPTLALFTPEQGYRYQDGKQEGYGRINFYVTGNPKKMEVKPISHDLGELLQIHRAYSDTLQMYFNPEKANFKDKRTRLKFTLTHDAVTDSIPTVLYDNSIKYNFKVYGGTDDMTPAKKLQIGADYPIDTFNTKFISVKKDSVALDFTVKKINYRKLQIDFPIQWESKYQVELLPGAITNWFGKENDTVAIDFGTKRERDYGNLELILQNKPDSPFWLKLFDSSNKEIYSIYTTDSKFDFKFLPPKKYHFQIWVDENKNKRYDTGNILENRQPEPVYIYPDPINVKAFWDVKETWVLPKKE
ncbi:Ig-like domain-containing protein [Ornithobacterium rhinotracheale]|uniref:Ig-like domain-containing protein n=1 Tax=Ornithobacterium rhinotracheale TaxID=28251 RepID=UPI004036B9B1